MMIRHAVWFALAAVGVLAAGCNDGGSAGAKKRVFYINSYHKGYGSSDEVMKGIEATLAGRGVELRTFFMDTKRKSAEADMAKAASEALRVIQEFKPHVIIASDDNAVKYVIAPNFKTGPIPVIFCGVNWSCEQYDLPTSNVTGMVEVVPIIETIQEIQKVVPNVRKLLVLTEDSTSAKSNRELLDPRYKARGLERAYVFAKDYAQWKEAFLDGQESADLIYLPTNGAVEGWVEEDAREFVLSEIRKPVITCDDFMMVYAAFGLTKVAREQGEWAAEAALRVIGGTRPSDIPVVRNEKTEAWINPVLAERVGLKLDPELEKRCKRVGQ